MDYTNTNIEFRTDQLTGRLISIHHNGIGWVEYLKKTGHVWVADTPGPNLYQTWSKQASANIIEKYVEKSEVIGLIQHLSRIRLDQPFIMPLFIKTDLNDPVISAGNCRMAACVINDTPADKISAIVYSNHNDTPKDFENIRELESTEEFEELYGLQDIDYKLSVRLEGENDYNIISSVIRHTIFDRNEIEKVHTQAAGNCFAFWKRFTDDDTGKIDIEIHCTQDVRKLVQESPLFNITFIHQLPNEWVWSYGKILSSYRKKDDNTRISTLNLWLFNITEPVHLELLLPWIDNTYSSFYSRNEKSVLFETSHITSMQVIGNWVK